MPARLLHGCAFVVALLPRLRLPQALAQLVSRIAAQRYDCKIGERGRGTGGGFLLDLDR